MHNQEQIEAARAEFNRIWNKSLCWNYIGPDINEAHILYNACWQSFLHGLRWVALPEEITNEK